MKIFDCFMYFDEDLLLDLRLNYLNKYVDYFVVVESKFNHKGEVKKLKFDKKNFKKFENKIIYIVQDQDPEGIEEIKSNESIIRINQKYILNAGRRENAQRNVISKGLEKAKKDDWIIISDLDEIPNLENLNIEKTKEKFIFFKQDMMYYKFNLKFDNFKWVGSKACRKKDLISPQWLRNIKDKNYPWWRLDVYYSKKKYSNIKFIKDGGWHFSYLKTPEEIEYKLKSYLHHREYDLNPIGVDKIKKLILEKKAIYNLCLDQTSKKKIGTGANLVKVNLDTLPNYVIKNKEKLERWID
tara:strand:+ start:394 stop:1287 length:894 start_codon:yes stop_codon:yes gene_type:complete